MQFFEDRSDAACRVVCASLAEALFSLGATLWGRPESCPPTFK